jgi:hypothetical protein
MAAKGLRRGAGDAPSSKIDSAVSGSDLLTPSRPAGKALRLLRANLARVREPALRERLSRAIASLEGRRA